LDFTFHERRKSVLAKTHSFGIQGIDAYPVTIEIDVSNGLPGTTIVGLPDNAIKESKDRIRAAIRNSGYEYPFMKTVINLSPAHIKKEGAAFELAMALGILAATRQIPPENLSRFVLIGELSLDGRLRPIRGALAIALACHQHRFDGLVTPQTNVAEAALCAKTAVWGVESLKQAVAFLQQPQHIPPAKTAPIPAPSIKTAGGKDDFAEVKGQYLVKRGLEIAAAGGHNVLMIGPPGCGKSMLAKRFPSILPDMTPDESLEVTRIHSITGLLPPEKGLITTRPFRSPHHTTSDVALVGGGSFPKPGEVTLAHNGILFLDELPEFSRNALEALRQPMEDQTVTIARASRVLRFPAKFQLIAAMNPSPGGQFARNAHAASHETRKYLARISGPLLDRIDIHLEVDALAPGDLFVELNAESSSEIKQRTLAARARQTARFDGTGTFTNAQMNHRQVREFCRMDASGQAFLQKAIAELGFSARAYDKILKVARTISDLAEEERVQTDHLAEAIQYRNLDRTQWGG
jgi:magnesium chelatase family protein